VKNPSDTRARVLAAEPRAVLFDLLTALLDSAALWDAVAGGVEKGRPNPAQRGLRFTIVRAPRP